MNCPFNGGECTAECAVYNSILKGCAFSVNVFAIGEEIANCKLQLKEISQEIAMLNNTLRPSMERMTEMLEHVAEATESSSEAMSVIGLALEEQEDETPTQEVTA